MQGPYARGVSWPLTMMAIIASVILALGLIPPYFELAKRNGRVIGIGMISGDETVAGSSLVLY
jgi:hypothetical protein